VINPYDDEDPKAIVWSTINDFMDGNGATDDWKTITVALEAAGMRELTDEIMEAICNCRQLKARHEKLQLLMDERPAINQGTLAAYLAWTGDVYRFDMGLTS
jgi:hypothetical protein